VLCRCAFVYAFFTRTTIQSGLRFRFWVQVCEDSRLVGMGDWGQKKYLTPDRLIFTFLSKLLGAGLRFHHCRCALQLKCGIFAENCPTSIAENQTFRR
jgi:hypothetical protein